MKSSLIALLITAVSASFFCSNAQAGVGVLGGASFFHVSTSYDNGVQSQPSIPDRNAHAGWMAGLAFQSNFAWANVEIDGLYNNRTLNVLGQNITSPSIEVPVLARFSLIPSIVDVGVGPYFGFNVGNNDLNISSPDIGAVGSVRLTIPMPGVHLYVDGRYEFGFTNLSNVPGLNLHTREFQVLAGIDLPIFGGDSSSSN